MIINLKENVLKEVRKDIEACDKYRKENDPGCRKCLLACPAGKDPTIQIDELNKATLWEIEANEKIYNFAFSCMQTATCTLACPLKLKRDLMMLQLKSILDKPKVIRKYNLLRWTDNWLIWKVLQKWFEFKNKSKMWNRLSSYLWKKLKSSKTLFYFWCYINTTKISNNTLKLADKFWEKDFEVLWWLATCCGYPQYLQWSFDLAEKYLWNLYTSINELKPERIITSCMECYWALLLILKNSDLKFKAITTTDWIEENKNKIDFDKIKKEDVIFHDPCLKCHKLQKCKWPREVLEKFAKVDEFNKNKEESLCCTYYAFNFNPKNRKQLHDIKKDEVVDKRHHTLVTECITCDDAYNKSFSWENFNTTNIVDYLVERLDNPSRTKEKIKSVDIDQVWDDWIVFWKYSCDVCAWVYDENKWDPDWWLAPWTKFEDIPATWKCPVCGVWKDQFTKIIKGDWSEEFVNWWALWEWISYLWKYEKAKDDVETDMRSIFEKAVTWKSEVSAMRTRKFKNLFEDIVFLPWQLARKPLREDEAEISLKTIIWPSAKKPLEIELPFFVSHMSFWSMSKESKVALAKWSKEVKTLICWWEWWMLPDEQSNAYKYVFEYSTWRFWATEEVMKKADAIDIKIWQAAKAGMWWHLLWDKVTEEIAKVRHVEPWKTVISPANHFDINSKEDLKNKVEWLKKVVEWKPVWIKIASSNVESDMEVALFCEPDFITIDCRWWATWAAPIHVKDNVCIPAPYAVYRARKYMNEKWIKDVSLIITWWMRTSADIAKCLAMWADVIWLSTTAMIGIWCQQYKVCHKWTCPVWIATQDPELRKRFDPEKSAEMLTNLLTVYKNEIEDYVRIIGKTNIHDLDVNDLLTLSNEISQNTNVKHA